MAALTPKPLKACAMRATLLDECGVPVDTTTIVNSQITFKDFISLSFSPNVEAGQDYTLRNACGELVYNTKDCDQVKYFDLTLQVAGLQPHLEELFGISNALLNGTGDVIGSVMKDTSGASASASGNCSSNILLEVWTNNASKERCADNSDCPYVRWILPLTTNWSISGDTSFTNDIIGLEMTGIAESNGSFTAPFTPVTSDPDLTAPFITAIQDGGPVTWVCTTTLPTVVPGDYSSTAT